MVSEVLKKYLKEKNMPIRVFADICKVHTLTVYKWLNGQSQIRPFNALKIEKATRGDIKYEQLTTSPRKMKKKSNTV